MGGRQREKAYFAIWLLAITGVASVLRLRGLDGQLFFGDEFHLLALLEALSRPERPGLPGLEPHLPMAWLYHLLGQVVVLDERVLRTPIVAVGVVCPALVALGARRLLPADAALLLGMLLAIHPLLILYSRFVRPYGICVLLLMGVVFLLDRWLESDRPTPLVGAVLCAVLASWLHLLSLVTAGLTFFAALLIAVSESDPRRSGAGRRRAWLVVLAGGACLALVVGLFASMDLLGGLWKNTLVGKTASGDLRPGAIQTAAQILVGMPDRVAVLVFLGLALTGFGLLLRRRRARALLVLVPALGVPPVILLIDPYAMDYDLVVARYLVFVLPLWLMGASLAGVAALRPAGRRLSRGVSPSGEPRFDAVPWMSAALAGLLLWLGPYWSIYLPSNSFTHLNRFQRFAHLQGAPTSPRCSPNPEVHSFYAEIGNEVPVVLEWPLLSRTLVGGGQRPGGWPGADYTKEQAVHCRPVRLVFDRGWGPRVDLVGVVSLPAEAHELAPGALIVLHRLFAHRDEHSPGFPSHLRKHQRLARRLEERFGPPVFEDRELTVFRVPEPARSGARGPRPVEPRSARDAAPTERHGRLAAERRGGPLRGIGGEWRGERTCGVVAERLRRAPWRWRCGPAVAGRRGTRTSC